MFVPFGVFMGAQGQLISGRRVPPGVPAGTTTKGIIIIIIIIIIISIIIIIIICTRTREGQ